MIFEMTRDEAAEALSSRQFRERSFEEVLRLRDHLSRTDFYLGVSAGETLLGIFGFVRPSILETRAYCWLLETQAISAHKISFLRQARRVASEALREYGEIVGVCATRRAVEWLQWVGAEFDPPNRMGWHPFSIRSVNG